MLLLYCKRLSLSVTHRFTPAHPRSKGPKPVTAGPWRAHAIASEGSTVRLGIGSGPDWTVELAELGLEGPATTVSLTARGFVRWRDFVLRGL